MSRIISGDGDQSPVGPRSFWSRQFAPQRTRAQLIFDMIVGVHLPVLCFIFDPIVFRSGAFGIRALLPDYQFFVYLVAASEVSLLAIWLLYGVRFKSLALLIGSSLMAGAIFSLFIGVLILPFSLIGMMVFIGIFGFTPFLTAFVYLRNSIRAIRLQPKGLPFSAGFVLVTIATVYTIGLPATVSQATMWVADGWVDEVLYADERTATVAAYRLSWLPVVPDRKLNQILGEYERGSLERKQLLAQHYREITGEEIETRRRLID